MTLIIAILAAVWCVYKILSCDSFVNQFGSDEFYYEEWDLYHPNQLTDPHTS